MAEFNEQEQYALDAMVAVLHASDTVIEATKVEDAAMQQSDAAFAALDEYPSTQRMMEYINAAVEASGLAEDSDVVLIARAASEFALALSNAVDQSALDDLNKQVQF